MAHRSYLDFGSVRLVPNYSPARVSFTGISSSEPSNGHFVINMSQPATRSSRRKGRNSEQSFPAFQPLSTMGGVWVGRAGDWCVYLAIFQQRVPCIHLCTLQIKKKKGKRKLSAAKQLIQCVPAQWKHNVTGGMGEDERRMSQRDLRAAIWLLTSFTWLQIPLFCSTRAYSAGSLHHEETVVSGWSRGHMREVSTSLSSSAEPSSKISGMISCPWPPAGKVDVECALP